jgi:hypothetical protein
LGLFLSTRNKEGGKNEVPHFRFNGFISDSVLIWNVCQF